MAIKKQIFAAKHAKKEWRLSVNASRGEEFMNGQAMNFVRNYCRKHGMKGAVELTNESNGDTMNIVITDLYTIDVV